MTLPDQRATVGRGPRKAPEHSTISEGRLVTFSLSRGRSAGALVAVGLFAGTLVGCGGDEKHEPDRTLSASPEESSKGLHGGTFNATLPSGASVRITLPAAPPPDQDVDALRQEAGIDRALYAHISIDNRKGDRPVSVSRLVLTAEDGAIYRLDALPKVVPDWAAREVEPGEWAIAGGGRVPRDKARDINRRVAETVNTYTGDVPAGGQGEEILVGDLSRIPATFASMELIPAIGDSEERAVRPSPDSDNDPAAPRPASPTDPDVPEPSDSPGAPADGPGGEEPPRDGGAEPTTEPIPEDPPEPTGAPAPTDGPAPPGPEDPATPPPAAVVPELPVQPSVPAQAAGGQHAMQP